MFKGHGNAAEGMERGLATLVLNYEDLYARLRRPRNRLQWRHLQRVRAGLAAISKRWVAGAREPLWKPVCRHLDNAIEQSDYLQEKPAMRELLRRVLPQLAWFWGYRDLPRALQKRFAYAEIAGPRGPVLSHRLILGLVLLGPHCHYPHHRHRGVDESYLGWSGRVTINNRVLHPPPDCFYTPPGAMHWLRTVGAPCLLAYAWTGPRTRLLKPIMYLQQHNQGLLANELDSTDQS